MEIEEAEIGANKYREEQTRSLSCDVLLVTATEVEMRAVRDAFLQKTGTFEQHIIGDNTYFDLGVIGRARIFLVQSEMGAGGPGGATLVVHESIKALSPSAIVMVGIAFGLLPEKQNIGDILVSRQLFGYEMQRVEVNPDGQEVIKPRGDRPQASTRLLERFRASISGLVPRWHTHRLDLWRQDDPHLECNQRQAHLDLEGAFRLGQQSRMVS